MKILGIIGSPRKGGNSAILAEQVVSGGASKWAQAECVTLSDLSIAPCTACAACKQNGGVCVIEDDMAGLIEKMKSADALVLATPVYYGDVTAQMKAYIDRCYSLMDMQFNSLLKGKKAALVVTCAQPQDGMTEHTLKTLQQFCAFNQMQIVGEIKGSGVLMPGEAKEKSNLMNAAKALGEKLAG
jgi:multimeric flavodoxin WrbA